MYRSSSTDAAEDCTCRLPPSCHLKHTTFSRPALLEAHERTYHHFICHATEFTVEYENHQSARYKGKQKGRPECGRVFPDARTLECHQRECHDPIAKVKQDSGERIFACLSPTCDLFFRTPKGRRLHLIDKHGYPKEYFFGVTLHGIETRVRALGGGMLKAPWKERDEARRAAAKLEKEGAASRSPPKTVGEGMNVEEPPKTEPSSRSPPPSDPMDALTEGLKTTSISLVPRAVRKKQLEKAKGEQMQS